MVLSKNESEWSVTEEMKLFDALRHNKPVGVNKHFAIVKIVDQLRTSTGRNFTVDEVRTYLNTLYNISALNSYETTPFPNEETEFTLPEADFPDLISDGGSESDVRNSVADSLDLEQTIAEVKATKSKADRSVSDDSTPKRPPKRTRASNANTPTETPSSTKRRRTDQKH